MEKGSKLLETYIKNFVFFSLGGTHFFFGGYVPHMFSKVGSAEQIFSLKKQQKNRVLGTNSSPKLVCLELKFCQNQREMGLKMLNFLKNRKWRV